MKCKHCGQTKPEKPKTFITPKDAASFRKGDRYTEMYTFWVYILKVEKDHLWIISASAPCDFPKDGKIKRISKEEFRKTYWIYLVDRRQNVEGWLNGEK